MQGCPSNKIVSMLFSAKFLGLVICILKILLVIETAVISGTVVSKVYSQYYPQEAMIPSTLTKMLGEAAVAYIKLKSIGLNTKFGEYLLSSVKVI